MRMPAEVNQVFLDNMAQLWRHDPKLAHRVDELPSDAALDVEPSKAGLMTAVATTPDGRRLHLHSRYDPWREAVDFCKGLDRSEPYSVILFGLGLGYHVKALHEAFGDQIVIVVSEPDLVTIKTALEQTDLSKALATGRVEIVTQLDKDAAHERLGRHSTTLMLGMAFAAPPVSRDLNATFHTAFRRVITDYAAFAKMSLMTLVRNSAITCRNIANNLPTYVSTSPPDLIRRRFSGCPAILVAAGPSLSKNIGQLRALRDKAVLIAAQTTLKPLLNEGIVPHFVTALDFSEMSRQFFEGVQIPDELVLVAEPKATWHVIDTFRGTPKMDGRRVILLHNAFAHRCIGEDLARRTPMEAGATVMHLALYLAEWMGCDPIIFVGQDLGFTGSCYYAPGMAIHRAWHSELGRYGTLEMKEWERIVRNREILRRVKDIEGRDIYTDEQLFSYLEQFERDFAKSAARIIDATEGGAKKSGATVMTLRDAAESFCREPLAPERFEYVKSPRYTTEALGPARTALAARRDELTAFRGLCLDTREVLRELEGLLDDRVAFNRRIVQVDELRALVQEYDVVLRMVQDVSQLGELQKFAADRRPTGDAGGRAAAEHQLQRDGRFVTSLLEGCDRLAKTLDESLARFDAAMEAHA